MIRVYAIRAALKAFGEDLGTDGLIGVLENIFKEVYTEEVDLFKVEKRMICIKVDNTFISSTA
jgi:hypothetical protein